MRIGRRRARVVALLLAGGLPASLLLACDGRPEGGAGSAPGEESAPEAALAARPGQPLYVGTATIDTATGHLAAEWTIHVVTDSSMTEGVDLLLSDALRVTSVDGDAVAGFAEMPDPDGGPKTLAVSWSTPAASGDERRLRVAYEGVLFDEPSADGLNGISADWVELGLDSFWHPVIASFDQSLVGELTVRLPADWTVAASGEVSREGGAHVIRSRVPQVDFAFVASPDLVRAGSEDVGVFHRGASAETVQAVVDATAACRAWLTERFGDMPPLKMVLAPREDGGYARKNYIALADVGAFPAPVLSRFICHELSHYWSSAPSPRTADYWMTESFAELVSARHVRDAHGDSAYAAITEQWRSLSEGLPPVWTDTSTARAGAMVNYRKGPWLLTRLEERIGEDAFAAFLRAYMTEPTPTTPLLLERLEAAAGPEAAAWFRERLGQTS